MRIHFGHRHEETGEPATPTSGAPEPVPAPGHETLPVAERMDADVVTGHTTHLEWGSRSDVGLVRGHNEDSFLVQEPVFAVCDGMGGHAAGEVASAIAVRTISQQAPDVADDTKLGAAVEEANAAIIEAAKAGQGRQGMGCTASVVVIDKNKMAVAHVGDSRVYLLRGGVLVRVTHDHSYVEELVDAGEITADEARVHPSRSIITRALGSDPDMYADHFTLDVQAGDRIIICSDGLSSMVPDSTIESVSVSSPTPQSAADNLTSEALEAGGHDNVTVVVVDIVDDGSREVNRRVRRRRMLVWVLGVLAAFSVAAVTGAALVRSSWYLGNNNGTVGIYQGMNWDLFGLQLHNLVETTSVEVSDLPQATRLQLEVGIKMSSEDDALKAVDSYRAQIDHERSSAAAVATDVKSSTSEDLTQDDTGGSTDQAEGQDNPTTNQEGQGE